MPYAVERIGRDEIFGDGITFGGADPGRLNDNDLLPGDILVWYRATEEFDRVHDGIRAWTRGAYSHAGIYIGNGQSIDANPKTGFQVVSLSSLKSFFEVGSVLRWPGEHDISIAVRHARSMIGYKYAKLDAVLLPFRRRAALRRPEPAQGALDRCADKILSLRRRFPPRRAAYCSQMVVECYAACGVFNEREVAEACISANDLITIGNFEYMGFISASDEPRFHLLDLNAPVGRSGRHVWKRTSIFKRLLALLLAVTPGIRR